MNYTSVSTSPVPVRILTYMLFVAVFELVAGFAIIGL